MVTIPSHGRCFFLLFYPHYNHSITICTHKINVSPLGRASTSWLAPGCHSGVSGADCSSRSWHQWLISCGKFLDIDRNIPTWEVLLSTYGLSRRMPRKHPCGFERPCFCSWEARKTCLEVPDCKLLTLPLGCTTENHHFSWPNSSPMAPRFSPGDGGSFLLELQKAIEDDKAACT
jgi:hypothetical protein